MSPNPDLYPLLSQLLASPEDPPSLASLTPEDWHILGQLAKSHGVAPLLHYHANQHPWGESLPAEQRQSLAREYYASAAQNALLIAELERVLGVLNNAGIPVVVLKGAHVAQAFYPDPALRPMHDLDLLVHPEQLFPAIKALKDIGYRQQKITYHAVLTGGPDGRVNLELHWLLLPSRDPKAMMAWFWECTEPFGGDELSPRESFCFNPSANLLYLAGHLGMMHAGEQPRLMWLYDLDLVGRDGGMDVDWELLVAMFKEFGWPRVLYRKMSNGQGFLSTIIPGKILTNNDQSSDELVDHFQFTRVYSRQAIGELYWSGRVKAILGMTFPSKMYMMEMYRKQPLWAWPVSYIQRLALMITSNSDA